MADRPITPAQVPPSIAAVPQPVIVSGGVSLHPSLPAGSGPFVSDGWGWLPPPQVGMGANTPFPTPVVPPAPVPPSVAGYPQPQFATGSGTVPTAASLFPAFTAAGPSPPIIYSAVQPPPPVPLPLPTTPGVAPIVLGGWGLYGGPNPATPWPHEAKVAEEEAEEAWGTLQ